MYIYMYIYAPHTRVPTHSVSPHGLVPYARAQHSVGLHRRLRLRLSTYLHGLSLQPYNSRHRPSHTSTTW